MKDDPGTRRRPAGQIQRKPHDRREPRSNAAASSSPPRRRVIRARSPRAFRRPCRRRRRLRPACRRRRRRGPVPGTRRGRRSGRPGGGCRRAVVDDSRVWAGLGRRRAPRRKSPRRSRRCHQALLAEPDRRRRCASPTATRRFDAGELRPDYVCSARSAPMPGPSRTPQPQACRMVGDDGGGACIVQAGAAMEGVADAAATGADFVMLGRAVFDADDPGAAVSRANAMLDEKAPRFED